MVDDGSRNALAAAAAGQHIAAAVLALSTAEAHQAFARASGGKVRGSDVVHDVGKESLFGVEVPQPACHVGTGGWDFTRFRPVYGEPVTCGRCLRAGEARAAPPVDAPGQLALDLDALDC